MTDLTVATWNLEWKRPGSTACAEMLRRLEVHQPDVVCLTEAYATTLGGHVIEGQSDWGYPLVPGRRKVQLWSRQPWQKVDQVGDSDLPPGRFVSGQVETAAGKITVVGVCIPWRGAHVETGQRNRTPWEDHSTFLAGLGKVIARLEGAVIVLGDFNQYVPRRSAPMRVYEDMVTALGDRFEVATAGSIQPLDHQIVDHVAITRDLTVRKVTGLSNRSEAGRRLSDHAGVVVMLEANAV